MAEWYDNIVGDVKTAIETSLEQKSNKVTSLSSSSTDTEYPSARCVYDFVDDVIGDAIAYINQ